MALNTLLSIGPWVILLVISIITLGIIIFLTFTERILKRKVTLKQEKEDNSPTRRIKLLISSHEDPQDKLKRIGLIAREIFRDSYNVDSKTSYYELAEKFRSQGKQNATKLCQEMFKILYSGETLQPKRVHNLAKILEKINNETQEEKSFKKLEKDMKVSLKITKQRDSLLKKFSKVEDKLVDKFAKEKQAPEQQKQTSPAQTGTPQSKSLPTTKQAPTEFKTKRERLQNLPLVKLFKFRKTPETTPTSEIQPDKKQPSSKQEKKIQKERTQEKPIYQKINDLQREVIERQKQISKMETQQQIQELQKTTVEVKINKKEQWPPTTLTPRHLNETKKISPKIEKSFEKANKKIALLEDEIKDKQKDIEKLQLRPIPRIINPSIKPLIKKPRPIIGKIFGRSNETIDKEIEKKKKQIEIINLREEPYTHSDYNAPKVVAPKKQKIEAAPTKKPIKKEEFIHHVDNMDRLKERIRIRRMEL